MVSGNREILAWKSRGYTNQTSVGDIYIYIYRREREREKKKKKKDSDIYIYIYIYILYIYTGIYIPQHISNMTCGLVASPVLFSDPALLLSPSASAEDDEETEAEVGESS